MHKMVSIGDILHKRLTEEQHFLNSSTLTNGKRKTELEKAKEIETN